MLGNFKRRIRISGHWETRPRPPLPMPDCFYRVTCSHRIYFSSEGIDEVVDDVLRSSHYSGGVSYTLNLEKHTLLSKNMTLKHVMRYCRHLNRCADATEPRLEGRPFNAWQQQVNSYCVETTTRKQFGACLTTHGQSYCGQSNRSGTVI